MINLLDDLADAMLMSHQELLKLARSAPHRYKVFQIPKRTAGQFRTIAQPAKEVKALQYWVMTNVLSQFVVHPAAMAYVRDRNTADNARAHVRSRFLLKLDFTNFFPSIKAADFRGFMKSHASDFAEADIEILTRILFWARKGTQDLCLAIGAPSSPLLSNILLREFDVQVSTYCTGLDVNYTRYADDLTFSSPKANVLGKVEAKVAALCRAIESPRLAINSKKTVRASKKMSRRVTGLVLTNDNKVSLGHSEKRRIRASVHSFAIGRLNQELCLQLRGVLAYVNSVEPDFLKRLSRKYGAETIRQIQNLDSG